ncbi:MULTISPECIES: c-type cytochrome [Myxococcaceae]|uniref:c-type cytochrome n=1 Tax=Myxococcaceae TaxID=31 RepID=UPI001E65BE8B|nr:MULTISPECIES: cytochrome C [Myxococcaceae]
MSPRPLPLAFLLLALAAPALAADAPAPAVHPQPRSPDGTLTLGLCDGETAVKVEGVKEGEPLTREQALKASRELMSAWRQKNPQARWDPAPAKSAKPTALAQQSPQSPSTAGTRPRTPPQTAPPSSRPAAQPVQPQGPDAQSGGQEVREQAGARVQTGHTYGAFSARDEAIWAASTQDFVKEGHRVFHDADALGGTVAVSCDMCHPDAANTHPETYPKYQVQLGRVALLRDMINWCLQNPVRAKPMADDDPRMKAMEAYILAQRKGTKLEYGKH